MNAIRRPGLPNLCARPGDVGGPCLRRRPLGRRGSPGLHGWFFRRARRHAELITRLEDPELRTLAVRAQDMTAAVGEVTGAEPVYNMSFRETYRHYHALVAARGAEGAPAHQGDHLVGLLSEAVDRDVALALVPRSARPTSDVLPGEPPATR